MSEKEAGRPSAEIDLTPYAEQIGGALEAGTPCVLATSLDGQPDLAFKGSLMVWDREHLAYWERSLMETYAALRSSPRVAVLYRQPGQPPLRFYGEAELVSDPELRERVWGRVVPRERAQDPDKKGYAVLIRIDRVRQGRNVVQER